MDGSRKNLSGFDDMNEIYNFVNTTLSTKAAVKSKDESLTI